MRPPLKTDCSPRLPFRVPNTSIPEEFLGEVALNQEEFRLGFIVGHSTELQTATRIAKRATSAKIFICLLPSLEEILDNHTFVAAGFSYFSRSI